MKKINKTILGYAILIGVILSLSIAIQAFAQERTAQERIASEIIRFHVVANSDTKEDLEIKTNVQFALLNKVGSLIKESENIETTRHIIIENIDEIINYAQKIVNNYTNDKVIAGLYTRHFPMVRYGNMILPPGYYEALTISIGEGSGSNWWCVMFPMLCFLQNEPQATPEMQEIMREILTEEEYSAMFNREINVRFRTVDMWNARNRNRFDVAYNLALFQ